MFPITLVYRAFKELPEILHVVCYGAGALSRNGALLPQLAFCLRAALRYHASVSNSRPCEEGSM